MQLGLRTGFQSEIIFLAVADDLLHHRAQLVHLDRIDDVVLRLVVIFLRRLLEARGHLLDARVQDVGKAHQHGCRYVAQEQVVHDLLQVHLYAVLSRRSHDVAFLVDMIIVDAPAADAIELAGVLNAPFSHGSKNTDYLISIR
jgi:hypothetical protein